MMLDPSFADFLFIGLIALLIWGILFLVGRARGKNPAPSTAGEKEPDSR